MAIQFLDGCSHFVTAEGVRKYSAVGTCVIANTYPRRAGGKHWTITSSTLTYPLSAAKDTLVAGFGFYCLTQPAYAPTIQFTNDSGVQCSMIINSDGSVSIKRSTTVLGTSAPNVVKPNTWQYIEVKVYIHDSAGTYDVWVGGANVLTGTGADTKAQTSASATTVDFKGSGTAFYITDIYIDDANNHGDVRVDLLMPNGAGALTEWTPSAGGNYENVDDPGDMDDDATYNSSETPGQIDTYAFPDLEPTGADIIAVAVNMGVRKDDVGARQVNAIIRQGTTNYPSSPITVTEAYKVAQAIWENQANGSGVWTESAVNAAEFGIEMEA